MLAREGQIDPYAGVGFKKHLDALTSLRFFAAAAIVLHHFQGQLGVPVIPFVLGQGVSVFFVLSGFILTYVYPSLPTWASRRQFLLARFARLWPGYLASICIAYVLLYDTLWGNSTTWLLSVAFFDLTMTQSWVGLNAISYSLNPPSWSISTEFGLYFAFLILIPDFARTWWWKLIAALTVVGALILIATIAKLPWFGPLQYVDCIGLLYTFPPARFFEFTLGMIVALAFRRWGGTIRGHRLVWTLAECATVALLIWQSSVATIFFGTISTPGGWWLAVNGMPALPSAALIFLLACNRGLLARAFCLAPIVTLGEMSYSIYLLHLPITHYFFVNRVATTTTEWATMIFALLTVVGVSYFIWEVVEKPARSAIRKFANRPVLVPATIG